MSDIQEKLCGACNRVLPAEDFHAHPLGKLQLQPHCKVCSARQRRTRYTQRRADMLAKAAAQ
jgi:hypothetical protein